MVQGNFVMDHAKPSQAKPSQADISRQHSFLLTRKLLAWGTLHWLLERYSVSLFL
jgi:hypothetical protein